VFEQKKTFNKNNIRKRKEITDLINSNEGHYISLFGDLLSTKEELISHIFDAYKKEDKSDFNAIYDKVVNNKC
jgi:hypothetical protein